MQHLDEGTIHAWLDEALKPDEAADVEQHVAECATCSAAVAEARGFIAASSRILSALDDVPVVAKREVVKAPTTVATERQLPRRRSRTPLYAMAATLFLAVGAVTVSRVMSRGGAAVAPMADSAMASVAQPAAPMSTRAIVPDAPPGPAPRPSPAAGARFEPRSSVEGRATAQAAKAVTPLQKAGPERDQVAGNVAAAERAAERSRADVAPAPPPTAPAPKRLADRADSVRVDSMARRGVAALEQAVPASISRSAGAPQIRMLVATPADAQGFAARGVGRYAGCYAVEPVETGARERDARREEAPVLPSRLALDSSGSSATDAARASTTPAKTNSLGVASAAWRQLAPNQVEVRWAVADGSSFILVAEDVGGILRGTVQSTGRQPLFTARVELRRIGC